MGSGTSRQKRAPALAVSSSLSRVNELRVSTAENDLLPALGNTLPQHANATHATSDKVSFQTPLKSMSQVTPQREANMRSSLPYTPYGDLVAQFPYYCPLCMEHFKDVLVSPCCGNYTCVQCCIEYLETKGLASPFSGPSTINDLLLQLQHMVAAAAAAAAGSGSGSGSSTTTRAQKAAVATSISCPQCMQVRASARVRTDCAACVTWIVCVWH